MARRKRLADVETGCEECGKPARYRHSPELMEWLHRDPWDAVWLCDKHFYMIEDEWFAVEIKEGRITEEEAEKVRSMRK